MLKEYEFVDIFVLITKFKDGFIMVDCKSNIRIYL
jgi:hypothetical protein